MNARSFLFGLLLTGLLSASAAPKPNIVFILADDLGSGDLGCYNKDSRIPTPNMDRIARAGMRFTDMHSPSGVCTPTRYGLLTGRYAWRTPLKSGVLWGYSTSLIETNRLNLPKLLKQQGYATAGIGKWHLGFQSGDPTNRNVKVDYSKPLRPGPVTAGFDYFFGIPASLDMEPYLYVENDHAVEQPTEQVEASKQQRQGGKGFWRAGPIAPGFKHDAVLPMITKKAVGYLERRTKESPGQPFFLYFPLTAPHEPWQPADEFRGKSRAGDYGDFVAQVDWTVGQVLESLDRLKLADNTLVILTSDNGAHWTPADIEKFGHRANMHYRGQKSDIWEAGHRVPFVVRWPSRIRPGTTSDQLACLTDMMATFAALLGEKLPADSGEDSFNLLPALLGEKSVEPMRDAIVNHSGNGVFAIRQGSWKLVQGLGSGGFTQPARVEPTPDGPKGQLYNLTEDISETSNLYLEKQEIVARLSALLEKYRRDARSRDR
ncbi:MAG TPA: arylsulfatase [Verrucomicrobiae bacterium]|nr:arylsulfatase [Verrucomicrobiae bacterium]